MAGTPARDDNLRLILSPVEKKKIDELRRRAWWKFAIGAGFIAATVTYIGLYAVLGERDYEALPGALRWRLGPAAVAGVFLSPLFVASAAWDALKAMRFRREFEAFHRSFGRDPDAVKTPASWTVE